MKSIGRMSIFGSLLALSPYAFAAAASAQTARSADHIVAGAGAVVIPTFEGSDEMRVLPFPVLDVQQGPFFLNARDGAGILVLSDDVFSVGASVALVGGYRRRDVPDGIDRIRFSPGARLFSKVRLGGLLVSIGGTRALGGTDGIVADATVAYTAPLSSRVLITPSVTATWANRRYMDRYFGVSARKALASGLPRFEAKSGFKNVGAALTGTFILTDRISLTGTAGAIRVLNDAAASPINERRWNPSGFLGVAYRF